MNPGDDALDVTLEDELERDQAAAAETKPQPRHKPPKRQRARKAKAKAKLEAGLAVLPLVRRRYTSQPARFVIGAAGEAEEELGSPADLVIVAVEEGKAGEAADLIREALGASS